MLNFIFIRIFGYVAAGYTTLACSAFLIGVSVICNLLFPYRILRYAILFASAGLVFWKRELLMNTMADIRKK